MDTKNLELAQTFERIADALELKAESGFRVLAYRRASRVLTELAEDIAVLDKEGRLETVPGIGSGIGRKIHEYLTTGRMKKLDEAQAGLPPGLFALLDIHGLGPKTAKLLHERLGVASLDDLKRVLENGSAAELPGMGSKKVDNILKALQLEEKSAGRMYLNEAFALAGAVVEHLTSDPSVRQAVAAGSLRRGKETIGDIDILAAGKDGPRIIERFTAHPDVSRVLAAGGTKASALFKSGPGLRQVDLRVVDESSYGAALQYFTGSKDHNVALRALAQRKGFKLSEYGLFRGRKKVAGRTEHEVYAATGLPYIEPELRENRGELEAAAQGRLPRLVELSDVKSDLHIHSSRSDGSSSVEEIVAASRGLGYSHIAITEHSASAAYAGGLKADDLLRFCDWVDEFNSGSPGFKLLKSSEVDITVSGALDYPDTVLRRLDLVVASIHQAFKKNATERTCDAVANPMVHVVAHPSGRIIGKRPGYDIDLGRVIEAAAHHRKVLEVNAYYGRLDLSDVWAREAKEAGVKLAVSTDAHSVGDLDWMKYGIMVARRAWLTRSDVINCLSFPRLLKFLASIAPR